MARRKMSKGVLVFYVNVGSLSKEKAMDFVEAWKESLYATMETCQSAPLPKDITLLFIPVRPPEESFVDYIPFDGVTKEALGELREIRRLINGTDVDE